MANVLTDFLDKFEPVEEENLFACDEVVPEGSQECSCDLESSCQSSDAANEALRNIRNFDAKSGKNTAQFISDVAEAGAAIPELYHRDFMRRLREKLSGQRAQNIDLAKFESIQALISYLDTNYGHNKSTMTLITELGQLAQRDSESVFDYSERLSDLTDELKIAENRDKSGIAITEACLIETFVRGLKQDIITRMPKTETLRDAYREAQRIEKILIAEKELRSKNTTARGCVFCNTKSHETLDCEVFLAIKRKNTPAPDTSETRVDNAYYAPRVKLPYVVTCDASAFAIGGFLAQKNNGIDMPIGFASRTLTDTEKKYDTYSREALAIVFTITKFKPYLMGNRFTVYTDHKPLLYFRNSSTDPNSRHRSQRYDNSSIKGLQGLEDEVILKRRYEEIMNDWVVNHLELKGRELLVQSDHCRLRRRGPLVRIHSARVVETEDPASSSIEERVETEESSSRTTTSRAGTGGSSSRVTTPNAGEASPTSRAMTSRAGARGSSVKPTTTGAIGGGSSSTRAPKAPRNVRASCLTASSKARAWDGSEGDEHPGCPHHRATDHGARPPWGKGPWAPPPAGYSSSHNIIKANFTSSTTGRSCPGQ
ncbi:unnamed protein product [Trichogramma brassicae]|uniref:Reverse transcriptase RNase H-like domain-containing protein n=1 Tax=Trichogramma brassicae TaxID=86971 RepID=A0A6H5HU62_9HYME|nr:unnamed protein product [Trichogramma brassicae]